ncbi:hypothetical protein HKX48_006604 [Thoreauomyces humboldtii]|nr:hypothetical protein HKX48_006604 [Thoreauomyces humboldtii]
MRTPLKLPTSSPSRRTHIQATGAYTSCASASNKLTYQWSIPGGFASTVTTATSATLYVPGGLTVPTSGTVVTVVVSTADGSTATGTVTLLPVAHSIVAAIAGGATRSVGPAMNVILDASPSKDGPYPNQPLTFAWTCTVTSGTGSCPSNIATSTANLINIPAGTLTAGSYAFQVSVSNPLATGVSAQTAATTITVNADITISCTLNYDSSAVGADSIIASNQIGFRSTCVGGGVATATYSWTSVPAGLVVPANLVYGSATSSYVYFAANKLSVGTVSLTLNAQASGKTASGGVPAPVTASTSITILAPPTIGTLGVAPATGPAFTQTFSLDAEGFSSNVGSDPTLKYAFSYLTCTQCTSSDPEYTLSTKSTTNTINVNLPVQGTLTIRVRAYDTKGGSSSYDFPNVVVTAVTNPAAALSQQSDQLAAAVASGNVQGLLAASSNQASVLALINAGGYSKDSIATAAAAQAGAITAISNIAASAKDSDTANSVTKALLNNDLSIMTPSQQTSALGAVNTLSGNIVADTTPGSAPLDQGAGGSVVNTLGNLLPTASNSSLVMLERRSLAGTVYPKKSSLATVTDPAVEIQGIEAAHQSGAALSKGGACIAGSRPLQITGATAGTALATQFVPLYADPSSYENATTVIGYRSAQVLHPNFTTTTDFTAVPASGLNAAQGCTVSTSLVLLGAHNTTDTSTYSAVLSVSYANAATAISSQLGGTMINFWLPEETVRPDNTTTAQCNVWNSATSAFTKAGCTALDETLLSDGMYLIHCECPFPTVPTSLERRDGTSTIPYGDFVISRVAVTPNNNNNGGSSSKLSGGAIAGITIGSVVGAAAIVSVGVLIAQKNKVPRTTPL